MATWADVEALGYSAKESAPGVRFVSGFGLSTYVAENDQEQIDSLADPVLHAQRIAPEPTLAVVASADTAVAVAPLPKTASLADVIAAVNALTSTG